jgi:hypothetical protein
VIGSSGDPVIGSQTVYHKGHEGARRKNPSEIEEGKTLTIAEVHAKVG